jgi:hypothetical protein
MAEPTRTGNYPGSGAIAGAASAFVFVVIHDIFISNIWSSIVLMMVAGALCGLCLGWTYGLMFDSASLGSWVVFNVTFTAMFIALGAVSVAVFEPVATVAALVEADEPPGELIGEALPMTITFTLGAAVLVSLMFGRSWRQFGSALVTSVVLVTLLGLNVSVIGLVDIPRGSFYLVVELFGLILALAVVFAVVFAVLERKTLSARDPSETRSPTA